MMDVNDKPAVEIRDLRHSYVTGSRRLEILRGANCRIERGK